MREINVGALIRLKNARHLLTKNQYDALRRKVREGDVTGAMKKLQALMLLQGSNAVKHQK
jgi:hypothetical protein